MKEMSFLGSVIGLGIFIVGCLECFMGYKLFKILNMVKGFLFGAIIGMIPLMTTQFIGSEIGRIFVEILIILVPGIIGALLANFLHMVCVFLSAFVVGVFLGIVLLGSLDNVGVALVGGIILGIIFGIVSCILEKYVRIIKSAITGAAMMGVSVALILMNIPVAILCFILFTVLGIVVQSNASKKKAGNMNVEDISDFSLETVQNIEDTLAESVKGNAADENVEQLAVVLQETEEEKNY